MLAKDEECDTGQEYLRTSHVNIQNYHFYLNAAPSSLQPMMTLPLRVTVRCNDLEEKKILAKSQISQDIWTTSDKWIYLHFFFKD